MGKWERRSRVPDRRCSFVRGIPGSDTTERMVWRGPYRQDHTKRTVKIPTTFHLRIFLLFRHHCDENGSFYYSRSFKRCCQSIISGVLSNEASNHHIPIPCSHTEWQIRRCFSYHLGFEILACEISNIAIPALLQVPISQRRPKL